jgi:PAS domain S-box-containing protein
MPPPGLSGTERAGYSMSGRAAGEGVDRLKPTQESRQRAHIVLIWSKLQHRQPRYSGFTAWRWSLGLLVGCCALLLAPDAGYALNPERSVYHYFSRNWTRQNGLPVNGINAITQTRDGYIWLGTHTGLVRFDGVTFDEVGMPDLRELRNHIVSCLAPDPAGGLWFGLQNHGYGRLDGREEWIFGRGLDGDTHWAVTGVQLIGDAPDSRLLVSGTGLAGWRTPEGTIQPMFDAMDPDTPNHVAVAFLDSKGRCWLGTADQGLFCWQDDTLARVSDPVLDDAIFTAISEDREGNLWFGTSTGLHSYNSDLEPLDTAFLGNQVNALLVDREGSLWIGTTDSGLARWVDNRFEILRQADGLVGESVLSLAEDHEGSLWVGCKEGLSQLSDVKFQTLAAREGLPAKDVLSVTVSPRGGLWVAGADGLTYLSSWGEWYHAEPGPQDEYSKRVLEAPNGDLYVVRGRNEIEIFTNDGPTIRHPTPEMPVAMTQTDDGIVVSVGGSLYRADRRGIQPYLFEKGVDVPPMYWVLNLITARDGAVWVASVNGVFRVEDGRYRHWTLDDGSGNFSAHWVLEDADGAVWAATPAGIWRIKDNTLVTIGPNEGLFETNLYALMNDEYGFLWVDSSRGLFRVRLDELRAVADGDVAEVHCEPFDGPHSVRAADRYDQEHSVAKTGDGRIWFPAQNGVIMIDPADVSSNSVAPQVDIHHVHYDGADVAVSNRIVLPPGRGDLEISYTALTFIAPHKAQFRYQLEGYDTDWVEAADRRLVYYSKLSPGAYTFRVMARNADGVWCTAPASAEFVLTPRLVQTLWFKSLAGMMAVAGVSGIVAGRVRRSRTHQRRLEQANEILESKVQARTRELAEQRNMLRTLIDNLPDNVFIKDMESRVVLNNLAHARALGAATPDDTVGKSDLDYFPEEFARKYFEAEQALLREGTPYDGEETCLNLSTGNYRWTQTTKVPLRDEAGRIIGIGRNQPRYHGT